MSLKERKDMDPAFMWDTTELFENDEAFETALAEIDNEIDACGAYAGKLNNAKDVLAFLEAETLMMRHMNDLYCYASLRRSEDTRDGQAVSMFARAGAKAVKAESAVSFAEPELLGLDEETFNAILNDASLRDYHFYLLNIKDMKPHTLSAAEESLLSQFGEVFANPEHVSEALMDADLVFDDALDSKGEKHQVSSASYILLQNSLDRTLRENAFRSLYKGYKQHIHTFAQTYSGDVKAQTTEARIRHYNSSLEMRMSADHIPTAVYDRLIDAVHKRMDSMYRYVRLRKRLLGVDELHYYDLYTPLVKADPRHYTYEEAQKMVLSAVAPLGDEYVKRVQKAFDERWIDVYPNAGKTSGAYSSGSYDSNPYILLNFTGTLESVSTLAHEMGHSQHTWLTNHNQPAQYSGYTMFVAEVASTVNENLLIEQMLQKETDPQMRLALLNQYLEGFKGTVYRQTMFAEFEKEAHAMMERGEALNAEALNALYKKLIALYFGKDLVIDDEVQYEWARIPHFYYNFYVYVYATGYSSAVTISEKVLHEGAPAVKKYLEFLSMGSSQYPLDELAHAGVDLNTEKPVLEAIDKFDKVLDEAEKIADQLGL